MVYNPIKKNNENWSVYSFATKAAAEAKMTEAGLDRTPFKKDNKWHIHFDPYVGEELGSEDIKVLIVPAPDYPDIYN